MNATIRWIFALTGIMIAGCIPIGIGVDPRPDPILIQTGHVPAGSLRLAQVTRLVTRNELIQDKVYEALSASSIADSEIVDGSVMMARVYCCGLFAAENETKTVLYVPRGLNVAKGDIVEFRVGRRPEKGDAGLLNTVTRVVQKYGQDDGTCRWDPLSGRPWFKTLYCDWMPQDGWVKREELFNPTWFKPPTSSSTPK